MSRQARAPLFPFDTVLLALLALGTIVELNLVGRLMAADLLSLTLFPFLLAMRGRLLRHPTIKTIIFLIVVWLFGQIATDLYRQTPFEDWTRGWAKIVLFLITFCTVVMLSRLRRGALITFLTFFAIAAVVRLEMGVGELAEIGENWDTAWKFGYGYFLGVMVFLFVARWARRFGQSRTLNTLPFGAATVALLLNARSMFAFTALAATIQLFARSGRHMSNRALVGYAALLMLAATTVIGLYGYTAASGLLGETAQDKFEQQTRSPLGLLGGRAEILASSQAVIDSPILGHGSWAKDPYYVDLMDQRKAELGLSTIGLPRELGLIPTHSHILGAWVEAGVLGAIFWLYMLRLTLRALVTVIRQSPADIGLLSFLLISFLWDLLFSPFGLDRRIIDAGLICLIVAIIRPFQAAVPRQAHAPAELAPPFGRPPDKTTGMAGRLALRVDGNFIRNDRNGNR